MRDSFVPGAGRQWLARGFLCAALLMTANGPLQAQCTTTVTGKVYSPLGAANGGDPIPNILVYIPQTAVLPFSTTVGAGVTGGCSAQANLVSGNPLVNATTDAAGSFSLTTTGLTPGTYNIVIQAGKWRRQYPNAITACANTTGLNLTMPSTSSTTDGTIADLPHIAVVTGSADSIECIFQQIGISPSEITDPTGTGSINFYQGVTGPGQYLSTSTPKEAALVGSPSTLSTYDVVIFGCQGNTTEADATPTNQQNMVDYSNAGGRIFATHYGYNWLDTISPFDTSADWTYGKEQYSSGTGDVVPATIDQSYAEGVVLAQWLQNIGASYNNVQGQIGLEQVRTDTTAVNNPPAQSWVKLNTSSLYAGNPSMQFTFNTPIGAAGAPTVAATYVNTTTLFQPADAGDMVTVDVTNSSSASADSTLQLIIAMPGGVTATSAVDTGAPGWTCGITGSGATVTCTRTTPLAAGATDNVALTFNIDASATLGQSTITATLSGGGLADTNQCGRVLYNDYHVEEGSGNALYPRYCSTGLTSQERFLEFSLYNLSNFVAPMATDIIDIQATATILWPTPAAIPYGTPLGAAQLNATATYAGSSVSGTFVYTPPAGTVLPVGTSTLAVNFTPANVIDFTAASGSTSIRVVADTTTVTLASGTNPSYLGEPVTLTATVGSNGAAAAAQTVDFFDGLTQIGTGTTSATGVASFTTSALIVGTHKLTACVVASTDFGASCSAALLQLVTLIPSPPLATVTLLSSSANPSILGQAVTFTATAATTGTFSTVPAGTVTFYDGTTLLGTGTLNAGGAATLTTSSLTLGTHTITAAYGGSTTLAASASAAVVQLVLTTLPSAGTGYILAVDPVTMSIGVGTSQLVHVQVIGLNNFQQTVALSCTDMPAGTTCALAESTMPAGGGSTTMTVLPAAPSPCGSSTPYFTAGRGGQRAGRIASYAGLAIFGLLMTRRRRRLRRWMQGLTLLLALCALPLLNGCGGNCTSLGTPPGTYTLTVTAVSNGGSAQTETQTIVMNVHL
jgi:hypothetical protein